MVSRTEIAETKAIQQRTGKTFHLATRLLPRRVREDTYVLYAFFRTVDEVVDDPDPDPPAAQLAELDRIEAAVLGDETPEDTVLSAFRSVKERNGIADREVEAFLDAMRMDVHTDRYETFEELRSYLRGSSVAVGHMMTSLMDPPEPQRARPHASALGEAFQLTNFLRDVREDVRDYGRIYLPLETLADHGVDVGDVERCRFTPEFTEAMAVELQRTERLYDRGVAGIEYLPPDCRFGVLVAAVLYAEHHRLIRRQGYDVLSTRPSLTTRRRIALAARTWIRWRRTRDPVETFYAVSAVDPPGERSPEPEREVGHAGAPDGRSSVSKPVRTVKRSANALAGVVRDRP